MAACTEEKISMEDNAYTITWKDSSRSASATLHLYTNGTATIVVDAPDQYFFHTKEVVSYFWSETDSTFTLRHKENGFAMEYEVIDRADELIQLRFDNELSVEIRKDTSSQMLH